MTLKDIDSNRLLFNIHSKTLIKVVGYLIPEFKEYSGKIPKTKLFQYIILMYDENSSMWRSFPAYFTRKFQVARLVGFPTGKDGKYSKQISEMLIGLNKDVNNLAVRYIAEFARVEYTHLVALSIILDTETRKLLSGDIDKNADVILDRVTQKIGELTRVIFNSGDYDEISFVRQALYSQAEKDKLMFRPEAIAELLAQGLDLPDDFNPYGNGYKPEKMRFAGDNIDSAERKEYE